MEYNLLMARYKALKDKVVERKVAFAELMGFVEKETAFLTAPASMRFHMNKDCGLLEHSVNTAETLLKMKAVLAPELSDESCVIVALLHDLGKAGIPGQPQYLENEPTDRQKRAGYSAWTPYRFNNDLTFLSVPVRSIWLILPYMDLSQEETQAIVYHDGQYVEDNRSVAKHEKPLTLLLQYADNWCGFVIEMENPED